MSSSRRGKRRSTGDALAMVFLCLLSVVFIFPFYWVITGGFKDQRLTIQLPPQWFPVKPTLSNYVRLFDNSAGVWLLNSVFTSLTAMLLVCGVSVPAGYVLAKKRFHGRSMIFAMFVAAMALPKQVILVPLVRLVSSWGFHNTLAAVILPAVGWPFGIFLIKQFSQTIPGEILEAAKIDGCSELRTLMHIVVPMVKPGIGALAIFTFINTWNDYFMQLIMLNSRSRLTLPLGVATMQQEFATNYGVLMAGATLAALPILIVFFVFQQYFTQGITMGSVKG
ncbi:MAG: carbohydrate ABC transporter permease [Clostridia bacterium]|nr:carbohydrate ABC transporter permease [Clostridia bacterium]